MRKTFYNRGGKLRCGCKHLVLHLLRRRYTNYREAVSYDLCRTGGQKQTCIYKPVTLAFYAALVVKAVEMCGHVYDISVYPRGIIVPRGQLNLLRQLGQLFYKLPLYSLVEE